MTIDSLFFLQVVAVGKKAERRGTLHMGPIQLHLFKSQFPYNWTTFLQALPYGAPSDEKVVIHGLNP